MNMVYCRSCSAQIHETAPTCPKCGAPQQLAEASGMAVEQGFLDLGLAPLKRYAQFSGRSRRKEYWYFTIITYLIYMITVAINPMLYGIACLALLIPGISVGVRRIHDTGRSGWWLLVPIVNLVFLCLDSTPGDNKFGPGTKYA